MGQAPPILDYQPRRPRAMRYKVALICGTGVAGLSIAVAGLIYRARAVPVAVPPAPALPAPALASPEMGDMVSVSVQWTPTEPAQESAARSEP